jgi:PAS domain S-box-containing protein
VIRATLASFAAYVAAGLLGLALRPEWAPLAVFWPAAGVGTGAKALAWATQRRGPVILTAAAIAAALVAVNAPRHDVAATASLVVANLIESVVVGGAFVAARRRWPRPSSFVPCLAGAAIAGVGAGVVVTSLAVQPAIGHELDELVVTWVASNLAGILVVAPLVLLLRPGHAALWCPDEDVAVGRGRRTEAGVQLGFLAVLLWVSFGSSSNLPLTWVPVVGLLWSASRLGPRWTALSVVAVAVGDAACSAAGLGPFGADDSLKLALSSELFLAVIAVTSLTVVSSVVERRLTVEVADEQRQLYETMFTARAEGIVLYDHRCLPITANPAALELIGLELAQLRGELPLPAAWHATRPDGTHLRIEDRPVQRALATGEIVQDQIVGLHHADGRLVWVSMHVEPLVRPGETSPWAALTTMADVTRQHQLDRAKQEFISVVSHELRTPLTSLRGALGLLAAGDRAAFDDKQLRLVDIASTNADRLSRLVDDLLDIERLQAGHAPLRVDDLEAADLARISLDSMEEMANANGVRLVMGRCDGRVLADQDRIVQVLTNLLSNAIKFSPLGARVIVSTEVSGDHVRFEVRDHGRGIPASELDRIFDRFEQVDASDSREKGGTGLGLAITRELVHAHHGRIWVRSELGAGSSFFFSLPLPGESPGAVADDVQDEPLVGATR